MKMVNSIMEPLRKRYICNIKLKKGLMELEESLKFLRKE